MSVFRVLMALLTVFMGCDRMFLCFVVLTVRVMMGCLEVMVRGRMVARSRMVMMLHRGVFVLCHRSALLLRANSRTCQTLRTGCTMAIY